MDATGFPNTYKKHEYRSLKDLGLNCDTIILLAQ